MNNLDLVFERLGGKRYERYLAVLCPFHPDTKPSCFVYLDRYFCSACGAGGTTSNLLRKIGSLPERANVQSTSATRNPFTRWLTQFRTIQRICNTSSKRTSTYLGQRGISEHIQRSLKLGVLENWIVFPILDHFGDITGAVARRGGESISRTKYVLPYGQNSGLLYVPSWQAIKEQKEVFVTFGIIDAITLFILGKASCSTTTGQHINIEAFSNIKKKIIFIPDELEEKSAYQISTKLGLRGSVKVLPYPYGTKDVSDWFMQDRKSLEAIL